MYSVLTEIKQKVVNKTGCIIAGWILHNCDDGLVIKRKGGAEQIIKVFSTPALIMVLLADTTWQMGIL